MKVGIATTLSIAGVLAAGAAANDTVEIVSFATFEVSAQTFTGDVTASGGTFLPTGDTAAGVTATGRFGLTVFAAIGLTSGTASVVGNKSTMRTPAVWTLSFSIWLQSLSLLPFERL